MRRLPTRIAMLLLVLSAFVVSGCSSLDDGGTAGGAQQSPSVDVVALSMETARKTSDLAPGFPFQVPVFDGAVTTAEVVSPDTVWGYELTASHAPEVVAEWYRRAYANASWTLDSETLVSEGDPRAVVLFFAKGIGAESVIEITNGDDGGTAVNATVALGANIRETY